MIKKRLVSLGVSTALILSLVSFPLMAVGAPIAVTTEASLRSAVSGAVIPTTIELEDNISLTGTPLTIPAGADITLIGDYTLTGANNQATILISGGADLTIDGIAVTHVSGNQGRGVHNLGALTLESGKITGNTFNGWGAGVRNEGTFVINGGEVSHNEINDYAGGAGIYNIPSGSVYMYGGEISQNTTWWVGGGVANDGTFVLHAGDISHNTSSYWDGGGVINEGTFTQNGGAISHNTADYHGGGVVNDGGTFNMIDGIIESNSAEAGGGVANLHGSTFNYVDGTITNNSALIKGGGIYNAFSGAFALSNGRVTNNDAEHGGGIYNEPSVTSFTLSGGSVSDNTASGHGGGIFNSATTMLMDGGLVSGNNAAHGGGVYHSNDVATFTMSDGVISENAVTGSGGGVYGNADYFVINGGEISDNTASNGAGIYAEGNEQVTFKSGSITGNVASGHGGGIAMIQLDQLVVGAEAVFAGNSASVAFDRNPADDVLYTTNIDPTVSWTVPFTQGYNNFDIRYSNPGSQVPAFTVTFAPGLQGTFAPVTHTDLLRGVPTPTAPTPSGNAGWVFSGWSPIVGAQVTDNVTYVANWTPAGGTLVPDAGGSSQAPGQGEGGVTNGTTLPDTGDLASFLWLIPIALLGVALLSFAWGTRDEEGAVSKHS